MSCTQKKSFRLWGGKLCVLLCVAVLGALAGELFMCNHRAFVTRNCEPEELSLYDFLDSDEQFVADENGEVPLSEDGSITILMDGFSERSTALYLGFRSEKPEYEGIRKTVAFTIKLRDDASYYTSVEANSGFYIPETDGLESWYGALYSNGDLSRLEITITSVARDQPAFLSQVILNPQVPVAWQWVRIALFALGLWLLLCMLCFPWRRVDYVPGKTSHRLVIVLPMALLLAFQGFMAFGCLRPQGEEPLRGMFSFASAEDDEATDHYSHLLRAFIKGQTSLLLEPSQAVLDADNPYDRSELNEKGGVYQHDFAMYNGKYYIYFGPGPVLLLFYPFYLLTGKVLSNGLCGILLLLLGTLCVYLAVIAFARKFLRRVNLFLLSLSCFTAVFVAGWPFLLNGIGAYKLVVAMNVAMMAGALGFGFSACMQKRRGRRVRQFLLCGLCFAFQATCRANTLLLTTAFLAPSFVGVLTEKGTAWKSKLRDGLCFLVPALIGVGFVMWYNFDRFGSVAEFGQNHQLTFEDIHYNVFRLEYIPQALYYYFLNLPKFLAEFPYVVIPQRFINVTGNYFFSHEGILGALSYPVLWSLLTGGAALKSRAPLESGGRARGLERSLTVFLPVIISMGLAVVSYFFAGANPRYPLDFQFALTLCALLLWLALCGEESAPAAPAACVICCVLSVLVAAALGFDLLDPNFQSYSPEAFYSLARMFFPY